MPSIYINENDLKNVEDLRIDLIIKKKKEIKKAIIFSEIIKEGLMVIKKREGV
jgi:hypothetical protein